MQTFTNGSSYMQVVQCKVEWFNHNWSEGMVKQNGATLNKMVSLDIQLLVPKPPKIQEWNGQVKTGVV